LSENNFNVSEILTNIFSIFAKENVMKNEGRGKKFSVFNLSHNSTVDLTLGTNYENNVIKASTTITTTNFGLRFVSVDFHTSRSEALH